jgi:biopolymer transport protein ExbD
LNIEQNELVLKKGLNQQVVGKFKRVDGGDYNLEELHQTLIGIKKNNMGEDSIILEPNFDLPYEELVKIMDSVRMMYKTDEALFTKDKDGIDVKLKALFDKIIFGSLFS